MASTADPVQLKVICSECKVEERSKTDDVVQRLIKRAAYDDFWFHVAALLLGHASRVALRPRFSFENDTHDCNVDFVAI